MTEVAIALENFPGRSLMAAVMTTETSGPVPMAEIIRIGVPGNTHIWKDTPAADPVDDLCRFFHVAFSFGKQGRIP